MRLLGDLHGCLARNVKAFLPKQRWFQAGLLLFVAGDLFSATFLIREAVLR